MGFRNWVGSALRFVYVTYCCVEAKVVLAEVGLLAGSTYAATTHKHCAIDPTPDPWDEALGLLEPCGGCMGGPSAMPTASPRGWALPRPSPKCGLLCDSTQWWRVRALEIFVETFSSLSKVVMIASTLDQSFNHELGISFSSHLSYMGRSCCFQSLISGCTLKPNGTGSTWHFCPCNLLGKYEGGKACPH